MGGDQHVVDGLGGLGIISIHAPAWGATNTVSDAVKAVEISIHAPAWGATLFAGVLEHQQRDFNSRPRVGGDVTYAATSAIGYQFQFTPPRGGRPETAGSRGLVEAISIHAPAWGATDKQIKEWRAQIISIHAPAWGATRF